MNSLLPVSHSLGKVRLAKEADIEAIYKIYTPYISNSTVTFETEVPSFSDFLIRMNKLRSEFPLLVFEDLTGYVVGYAYISRYRERRAYQWCVESSVYVSEKYFGKDVGNILYKTLISLSKKMGYYRIYAVITLPNDRSEAFHKKWGFRKFAVFQKTGYKFGDWLDVVWYELDLENKNQIPGDIKFNPDEF